MWNQRRNFVGTDGVYYFVIKLRIKPKKFRFTQFLQFADKQRRRKSRMVNTFEVSF